MTASLLLKATGIRGNQFPAALCISVNEQVVHGIPGNYELKEGDIVSVDCGIVKDGFYGDSGLYVRGWFFT